MGGYPSYPSGMPRFMGLPIRVRWLGWTSDTCELQRNGWEVSVAQDPYRQTMQLALQNRVMKLVAIGPEVDFNYREVWDRDAYIQGLELPILHIAPRIEIVTIPMAAIGRGVEWNKFTPVDACPSVVTQEIKSLRDLVHFQPLPQAEEIIVPEKSVSELLQEILKKQIPEQDRYRQRVREEAMLARGRARDELPAERKVHAQIITLRNAA